MRKDKHDLIWNGLGFLIEILKGNVSGVVEAVESGKINFFTLEKLAVAQQLSGGLYPVLTGLGCAGLFPTRMIESLKSEYMSQWGRNERIARETLKLGEVFAKSEIDLIFLKGPLFVRRFYGDLDRRAVRDIDVMIQKKDVDACERILVNDGYKKTSRVLINQRITTSFTHHFEYWKKDIPLDLHWQLVNYFSVNIDYDRIWNQKTNT